jgi:hypothetical protein
VSFHKDILYLGQLIIDKLWYVEPWRQTNIVGVYFSEGFNRCYTLTCLDSRSDDILLFVSRLLSVGLLIGDGNE